MLVSAASAWEIATKHRLGKLPEAELLALDPMGCFEGEGFVPLAVTVEHGAGAGRLPGPHRDPFDRMLIAQAQAEGLIVATADAVFERYGVGGWYGEPCNKAHNTLRLAPHDNPQVIIPWQWPT